MPLIDTPLNGFLALKSSKITIPADLRGKTIGVCSNGFGRRMLLKLLESYQITDVDIKVISFDIIPALSSQSVDVIYGAYWNIEQVQCDAIDLALSFIPLSEWDIPEHPELILCAYSESIFFKNQTSKIQSILSKAYKECRSNPEKAFQLYSKANPQKSAKTLSWEKTAWLKTVPLLPSRKLLLENRWKNISQWLIRNEFIENSFTISNHLAIESQLSIE